MADGDFVKGKLSIRPQGYSLAVRMEAGPSTWLFETLDMPDIIRLGLWLKDNRPQ